MFVGESLGVPLIVDWLGDVRWSCRAYGAGRRLLDPLARAGVEVVCFFRHIVRRDGVRSNVGADVRRENCCHDLLEQHLEIQVYRLASKACHEPRRRFAVEVERLEESRCALPRLLPKELPYPFYEIVVSRLRPVVGGVGIEEECTLLFGYGGQYVCALCVRVNDVADVELNFLAG